jgi:hypothetical protein
LIERTLQLFGVRQYPWNGYQNDTIFWFVFFCYGGEGGFLAFKSVRAVSEYKKGICLSSSALPYLNSLIHTTRCHNGACMTVSDG